MKNNWKWSSLIFSTLAVVMSSCGGDKSTCYPPESKDLSKAYSSDSKGCACEAESKDVCVQGVALICESGYWQAVEDGPCMPEAVLCPDGTTSNSKDNCKCPAPMVEFKEGESCPANNYACKSFAPDFPKLACKIPTYTIDQCNTLGGIPVADIGTGSLLRNGCPDERKTLGIIDTASSGWDEGGLCCAPSSSCTKDSDCPSGKVCEGCGENDKKCVTGCHSQEQCAATEKCEKVECITCPCPSMCTVN